MAPEPDLYLRLCSTDRVGQAKGNEEIPQRTLVVINQHQCKQHCKILYRITEGLLGQCITVTAIQTHHKNQENHAQNQRADKIHPT